MSIDAVTRFFQSIVTGFSSRAGTQVAIGLAGGLWLVTSFLVVTQPERSVTHIYWKSAQRWSQGTDLYEAAQATGHGFLYPPPSVLVFVPFAVLPQFVGDVAWRAFGVVLLMVGLFRFCRLFETDVHRLFAHVAIVALVSALACLRIGQATLPMVGLMLLGTAAICRNQWREATMWLSVACLVKPLAIVIWLLAIAVYPRMRLASLVGILVVIALPFFAHRPAYVVEQYSAFLGSLPSIDARGATGYGAHLFGLLKTVGYSTPLNVQRVIRVAAAVTILICLRQIRRRHSGPTAAAYLYALSAIYIMLFSSRTENSTYCIVGPMLGLFYARELLVARDHARAAFVAVICIACAGSYEIGKWFTPPEVPAAWLAPLSCSVFAFYLAVTRPTWSGHSAPDLTQAVTEHRLAA